MRLKILILCFLLLCHLPAYAAWDFETDGTGDSLSSDSTHTLGIGTGTFTISGWVNRESGNVFATMFSNGDFDPAAYVSDTANGSWSYYDAGRVPACDTVIDTGVWHHLLLVRTGSTVSCFLDGVADNSDSNGGAWGTGVTLWIGFDNSGTDEMDGLIQEVAVWNVALSAAEIDGLSKKFAPQCFRPGSIVFYHPLLRESRPLLPVDTYTATGTAAPAAHNAMIYCH